MEMDDSKDRHFPAIFVSVQTNKNKNSFLKLFYFQEKLTIYCKIWYFVVNSNVEKNLFSFVYIFTFPSKRNEYRVKHILGRMINSWLWSWLAPRQHQLGKFHHVAWSHQAAMILRTSTRLFCKGLNIKGLLLMGLSIFEIYSDWTQACLIYTIWLTNFWTW